MNPIRCHLAVLWTLLHCAAACSQDAPLQWKFKVGDEHYFRSSQAIEMTMSFPSVKMATEVRQEIEMTWKVEAVDDSGAADISQEIHRLKMDLQIPGQIEAHFDTDEEKTPTGFAAMLFPLFKTMRAAPIRWKMSPRGEVTEVEIPLEVGSALKGSPGKGMLGDMASEKRFKQMMQQLTPVLPKAEDLKAGFQWTQISETDNAKLGTMVNKTTYTYDGPRSVDEDSLEVFKPELELEIAENEDSPEVEIVAQKGAGEILFSRGAGRLETTSFSQELDLRIRKSGQEVEQKILQKSSLRRIEPPPQKIEVNPEEDPSL